MKVCNEIQRRIDEADNIDSYDLDVARHTETCEACRRFAHERAALREMIGSTARVTAPINFDAMLRARLVEVKGRKGLAWLNAAFYLRAGAATAALAVTVLVAQHMGWFAPTATNPVNAPSEEATAGIVKPTEASKLKTQEDAKVAVDNQPRRVVIIPAGANTVGRSHAMTASVRRGAGVPELDTLDAAFVDTDAIMISGINGQRDV